ncbi:MAG: 2OG-Fe(II) oxygenase family protein [Pseudomonadota bacterium]
MFAIKTVAYDDPAAPADFTRSLRETGFAVLTGHPITPGRITALYEAWQRFFARAEDDKRAFVEDGPAGFFPFQSENAKGAAHKDLKEFFQIYPATELPDEVAEVTRAFYADLMIMGTTLLAWIEENTPQDVRATFAEPLTTMLERSEQTMLRIIHYPAQEGMTIEAGAERAAAHEDINLITLLVAGSAPGLQAQDTAGTWHAVPCDPGMIAVNVGDMLQLASGGHYPSTTHRVVNPDTGAGARFSMPMFVHPRPDVRLSMDKTAGAYLSERLKEIGLG